MSYNKVLKDFGEIDLDIFSPTITKVKRGRPKKVQPVADV